MSGFTQIDLSKLPAPDLIEALDFEGIVEAIRADLIARLPDLADALGLESSLITKAVQAFAYRELLLRQRVNDAGKAVMLPTALGADLDNIAALFGVERRLVDPGDPDAAPPVPPTYETDERLRTRTQLSLEAHTTAGPKGSYTFWALTASPDVRDVDVASPNPGEVVVTVLSASNGGVPPQAVLDAVDATLNDEDVRPLTDLVTVQAATVIDYAITATLTLFDGPDDQIVMAEARARVEAYADRQFALGRDITRSGLFAALHVEGVQNVDLTEPITDLDVSSDEAARGSVITVTFGGRDE